MKGLNEADHRAILLGFGTPTEKKNEEKKKELFPFFFFSMLGSDSREGGQVFEQKRPTLMFRELYKEQSGVPTGTKLERGYEKDQRHFFFHFIFLFAQKSYFFTL